MGDAGVFFAKLRRDFFVGVIFSAAGEVEFAIAIVSSYGNNSAADDLTAEAVVGTPTPEGFFGI